MEISSNGLFVCATQEEEIAGDKRFRLALKRMQKATQDYERMMKIRDQREANERRQKIRDFIRRLRSR